jgi:hypothetical protein
MCRERLYQAKNARIVFFTATPIVNSFQAKEEALSMLKLVKGAHAPHGNT